MSWPEYWTIQIFQHVNVYFEMAGKIVEHLDKATAKGFSKYLNFFKGRLIDSDEDAVKGERDDKHLTFVDDQNPADQADIGVCGESSVCHLNPPTHVICAPSFSHIVMLIMSMSWSACWPVAKSV